MKRNTLGSRVVKSRKSSIKTRRLYGGMEQDRKDKNGGMEQDLIALRKMALERNKAAKEAARIAALTEADKEHLNNARNQERMVAAERERQLQQLVAEAATAKKLAEAATAKKLEEAAASAKKLAEAEASAKKLAEADASAKKLAATAQKQWDLQIQEMREKHREKARKEGDEKKMKEDEKKMKEDEAAQKRMNDRLAETKKKKAVIVKFKSDLNVLIQKTAASETLDEVLGAMKEFSEYVKQHSMKEMEVVPREIFTELHNALQNALNGIKLDFGKKGKDATIREIETMWNTICATLDTELPLSFDLMLSSEELRNQVEEDAKLADGIREQEERENEVASLAYVRQLQEADEALARGGGEQVRRLPPDPRQFVLPDGRINYRVLRTDNVPQPPIVPNRDLENIIIQTRDNLWIPFIASAVNLGHVPGYTWMENGKTNGAGYRSDAVMNVREQAYRSNPPRFIAADVNFSVGVGYIWRLGSLGLGFYRDQRRGGLRTKKHKNNRKHNISRRARK